MEGCKSIYCVQRRPVSSCHTLLISGYTSAVHSPFGSDSFSALQSEGRLLPLPLMSLVVKGATANPGPHLFDETYDKLRTASPRRSYLCPRVSVLQNPPMCAHCFPVTCTWFKWQGHSETHMDHLYWYSTQLKCKKVLRIFGFQEKLSSV